jgi:hypothetical protein
MCVQRTTTCGRCVGAPLAKAGPTFTSDESFRETFVKSSPVNVRFG